MKKPANPQTVGVGYNSKPSDLLASIEKAASAIVQQVKRLRTEEERGGDAVGAYAAIRELRENMGTLEKLTEGVANSEAGYSDRADKQFLELESAMRDACKKRGWRVDGQWPTLYVERAIAIEVSEAKRSVMVAGRKVSSASAEAVVAVVEPLVRTLLPKGFSPKDFIRDLAAAYDSTRGSSSQLPIFDLYRELVVQAQGARFWRDARSDAFAGLSADQFRARISAALEAGVTNTPDGREMRLLPPLNSKDGLFMYQPTESRYGFVGRVEFVSMVRPATS